MTRQELKKHLRSNANTAAVSNRYPASCQGLKTYISLKTAWASPHLSGPGDAQHRKCFSAHWTGLKR
jgi:hypothetical protein